MILVCFQSAGQEQLAIGVNCYWSETLRAGVFLAHKLTCCDRSGIGSFFAPVKAYVKAKSDLSWHLGRCRELMPNLSLDETGRKLAEPRICIVLCRDAVQFLAAQQSK